MADTSVREAREPGEEWHASNRLVAALGRYYTVTMPIAEDYSATDIHLWESMDGVNWTSVNFHSCGRAPWRPRRWRGRPIHSC